MLNIAVFGTGRMAAAIVRAAETMQSCAVIALAGPRAPEFETAVPWVESLEELPSTPDLLIDFTLPDGTRVAAEWCRANGIALVSGVTGLPDDVQAALQAAAERVPVLWSPNLSLGVNLLADLAARAAAVIDADAPVEIEDIHHQWKKDAPSGTALMFGARIAGERGGNDEAIDYDSVREGEVIGVHTIRFRLVGEDIELIHRAHDRSIYASGAIRAGIWLRQQPARLYTAADWLAAG